MTPMPATFCLSVAPALTNCIPHRLDVEAEDEPESSGGTQARAVCFVEAAIKLLRVLAADVAPHLRQLHQQGIRGRAFSCSATPAAENSRQDQPEPDEQRQAPNDTRRPKERGACHQQTSQTARE
jgi:hypothetical protein